MLRAPRQLVCLAPRVCLAPQYSVVSRDFLAPRPCISLAPRIPPCLSRGLSNESNLSSPLPTKYDRSVEAGR